MSWYPDIKDDAFYKKLYNKVEFSEDTFKRDGAFLEPYQQFNRKYINIDTPYNSLLLFHQTGTGKTLGSISILENFKSLVGKDNGLERFLIITKNNTLQDTFKNEIIKLPDNQYITQNEKRNFHNPQIQRIVSNRIRNKYEFMNYDEIVNKIMGRTVVSQISGKKSRKISGELLKEFDNKIIVIDEVHNITGNYRYMALMRILQASKNIKLILLTATPIVDNTEEILYIVNLLNFKNPPFNITDNFDSLDENTDKDMLKNMKKFYKSGVIEKVSIKSSNKSSLLSFDTLNKITPKGKDLIKQYIKGRVSYVPKFPENFPEIMRKGVRLRKDKSNSVVVFKCPMSNYQEKCYLKAVSDKSHFLKKASDTATMCYNKSEDPSNSEFLNITPLTIDKIQKYSSKIYSMLNNLNLSKGISFIYSNYVDTSGTNLIEQVLKKNGYTKYTKNSKNDGKNYVKFTEELSKKERENIQGLINSPENNRGDIIKIVIGSPMISEGISFMNIRQVHILEPYWNLARNIQVEGRCIRNQSHFSLPAKDRNIEVYYYCATTSDGKDTIDGMKYMLSEEKDILNKDTERVLKENAVDCNNLMKIKKKPLDFDDFSPDCDYMKCDYSCDYTVDKKEAKDTITYNKYTDPYQISMAKKEVKRIFNGVKIVDIDYILKTLASSKLNEFNIYYAVDDLVNKKEEFVSTSFGLGVIIYYDKYYRFKKSLLTSRDKKMTIDDYLNKPVKKVIKKKAENIGDIIDKIYEKIDDTDSKIIGIKEKTKFKIVDARVIDNNANEREKSRGRDCMTIDKENIESMLTYLKINYKDVKPTKKNLCKLLHDYLDKKDLIITN